MRLGETEDLHAVPVVEEPDLSELTVRPLEDGDDLAHPHPASQLGQLSPGQLDVRARHGLAPAAHHHRRGSLRLRLLLLLLLLLLMLLLLS